MLGVGSRVRVRIKHLSEGLPQPGGGATQLLDLLPLPAALLLPGRRLLCHLVRDRVGMSVSVSAWVGVSAGASAGARVRG